jgi:hypothetical protein
MTDQGPTKGGPRADQGRTKGGPRDNQVIRLIKGWSSEGLATSGFMVFRFIVVRCIARTARSTNA